MMTDRASRLALRATLLASIAAAAFAAAPGAMAFPAYAKKEHKPCSYCHINPKGGGKRNANGLWYKKHNLSFAGYTRAKAAKEAGVPISQVPVAPPTPPSKSK